MPLSEKRVDNESPDSSHRYAEAYAKAGFRRARTRAEGLTTAILKEAEEHHHAVQVDRPGTRARQMGWEEVPYRRRGGRTPTAAEAFT